MAQTHILNILWYATSPFGSPGYVANDNVDVYYDDSTDAMVVKKNGGIVTAGSDIPQYFWYNLQSNFFYKTERLIQGQVCDGQDLVQFQRKATFPYMEYTLLIDHPSCDVLGTDIVCDLAFSLIYSVTKVSTEGANDGSITVTATSSNPIKYRLNSDFGYSDGTGQSSGTFSNLPRGEYIVFARDSKNCGAVITVIVGVQSTYNTLFQHEYYGEQTGYHHKVEVLKNGYSGGIVEVIGGNSEPAIYRLRGELENDKFVSILASEIEVSLMSTSNYYFLELYTNDHEKYRVRYSIDYGSGYEVVWAGKVLPNQYSEEYTSPPYPINLIAIDGLASLKDYPFFDDEGNRLIGSYKKIELIAFILKKIGLGINIRCGINMYATQMDSTDADDPLDQAYVDVLTYYIITSSPNCADVLRYIIEPYGAQIIQWGNCWNILRLEERVNAFDYREFDSDGTYVSNSSYNPGKDMKPSSQFNGLVWADRNQRMVINPGFGAIQLLYQLGRKENLLVNGDFQARKYASYSQPVVGGIVSGSSPDLTGFEIVNNGTVITRTTETIQNDNVALGLIVNEAGGYLLSDTITIKSINTDNIKFTLVYKVIAPDYGAPYTKVRVRIKYGGYYLLGDGTWTAFDTDNAFFVDKKDYGKYITSEIIAPSPDPDYFAGEDLYVRVYTAYSYYYQHANLSELKAFATGSTISGYRTELLSGGNVIYYELQESTDMDNDLSIVRPDDYHATTNPFQWIRITASPIGTSSTTLFIDRVQVQVLSRSKEFPDSAAFSQSMENNNRLILNKIIYHGSLLLNWQSVPYSGNNTLPVTLWLSYLFNTKTYYSANFNAGFESYEALGASEFFTGYIRDSLGEGYTTWTRDGVSESASIESIIMSMYATQYNRPWRSLQGNFTGDIQFTPIDIMRETMDSNRKYYPVNLVIVLKKDLYSGKFFEVTDATDPAEISAGFTTGFSLGYNS